LTIISGKIGDLNKVYFILVRTVCIELYMLIVTVLGKLGNEHVFKKVGLFKQNTLFETAVLEKKSKVLCWA